MKILHLKTQRGQPYGSTRRCCEMCGAMIWGISLPSHHQWTDDPEAFDSAKDHGFIKCTDYYTNTGEDDGR